MNALKPILLVALVAFAACLLASSGNQSVASSGSLAVVSLAHQDDSAVIAAYNSGIKTKDDFEVVFDFVSESANDAKWREIPWIPSLWDGVTVANEKKKPVFMWAMNGDPLGCV